MTIYLIILIYWGLMTLVLKQLFKYKIKKNSIIYVFIAGGTIFLLMSLRDISVGTDLLSYYNEFLNADLYLKLRSSEPGYSYFNYFFSSLGISFQLFLLIIAAIVVVSISRLYLKFSRNIMLSYYLFITLGLFAMTLTGLRQSIAIMITIFAFMSIMNNKKIAFFVLVFIASLFHNSAIIFLVIYFIKNVQLTKRKAIALYIITLSSYPFLDIFILIAEKLSPDRYIRRYMFLESNINPLVIIVYILIPLAILIVWNPSKKESESDTLISKLLIISCVNIIIYFLATEIVLIERISYYFMIYNTILIPNAIETIKNRDIKLISKIACVILPLIMFILSTSGGSLGIDNYKFFWE